MNGKEHNENLLEAILMASEMGNTTLEGIKSVPSEDAYIDVTSADIENLSRDGYVEFRGNDILLSERGLAIAKHTVRRHRLTEMLLFTLLGIDRDVASEIGCKVEHGIREEMLDGVCTLLGHPTSCPHGRPIPPGQCCKSRQTSVESQVVPLASLNPGERARIVYVQPRSHQRLHRLSSLGLIPGVEVALHRRHPAYCLRFEGTELAVDTGVAEDIQVCRIPENGNGG